MHEEKKISFGAWEGGNGEGGDKKKVNKTVMG